MSDPKEWVAGQLIICINAEPADPPGPGHSVRDLLKPLELGKLYVIREIDLRSVADYGQVLIRVEGILNVKRPTLYGLIEIGYAGDRFRPNSTPFDPVPWGGTTFGPF
jgi:hypothetical protein